MTTTIATTSIMNIVNSSLNVTSTFNALAGSIKNDILIGLFPWLIPTILAVLGLLSFAIYNLVESALEKKNNKAWEEERNLSKAEVKIALGYFHMYLYKTIYKEKTSSQDTKDGKAIREIESALSMIKNALNCLDKIKKKDCFFALCVAKNNFSYYLAKKWDYHRNKKSESSFQQFLEKDKKKLQKYLGDKGIAIDCMNYLKEKKASGKYPKLAHEFEDTFLCIKKTFNIKNVK